MTIAADSQTFGSEELDADRPLPPLQQADLDREAISDLFLDISAATDLVTIHVKYHPTAHVADDPSVSLESAQDLLFNGMATAVQLRYRYRGSLWCDTVLRIDECFRLVRIEQSNAP